MTGPIRLESSPKRVRAYLAGKVVADTVRAELAWENPHYPVYYLPRGDVDVELLPSTAWRVVEPGGLVRLEWSAMDAWFEEEEEVFVHPHDPHKRIDILHSARHVVVSIRGVTLAETRRPTLVFETGLPTRYYFAKPDVRMDLLTPIAKRTGCAYKGFASYWVYKIGEDVIEQDVAWSYATPLAECVKIAALLGFYNETLDIDVDGVRLAKPTTEFSR
jgi:uncharacterized protein (DUF427 family)